MLCVCSGVSEMGTSSMRVDICGSSDFKDVVTKPVGPILRICSVSWRQVSSFFSTTKYSMTLSSARERTADAGGPSSGIESASEKMTILCSKSSSL